MSSVFMISDAAKKVMVEAHVLRYWEEELGLPIKRNELGHRYYTEEDVKRFMEIKELKERGLQLKAIRMVLKNGKLDMLPKEMEEELSLQGEAEAEMPAPGEKTATEAKIVDIPLKTEADKPEAAEQEPLLEEQKAETAQTVYTVQEVPEAVNDKEKIPEKKKAEASKAEKKKKKKAAAPTIAERQKAELQQEKAQKQKQQAEAPSYELMETRSDTLKAETKEDKSMRLQWLLQQLFRQALQENNEYLCREIKESLLKELDYQFRIQEEKQEERDAERLKQEEEHYKKIDELLRKKRRLLKR